MFLLGPPLTLAVLHVTSRKGGVNNSMAEPQHVGEVVIGVDELEATRDANKSEGPAESAAPLLNESLLTGWVDLRSEWGLPTEWGLTPILLLADTRATLASLRALEPFNVGALPPLFSSLCLGSKGALVVGSGADEGAWLSLAAEMGCKAVAIDPAPLSVRRLRAMASKNGRGRGPIGKKFRVVQGLLAPSSGVSAEVGSVRLDQLLEERIGLWHLDVRGAEVLALRSASALFEAQLIDRVLVAWSPAMWHKFNVSLSAGLAEARAIFLRAEWHCVVACSGRPYNFSSDSLGACRQDWAPRGSDSLWPADVYCTAPHVQYWEDEAMRRYVLASRLQTARRKAAREAGCVAAPPHSLDRSRT